MKTRPRKRQESPAISDVDAFVERLFEEGGANIYSMSQQLVRAFMYNFNFSGTIVQPKAHRVVVR